MHANNFGFLRLLLAALVILSHSWTLIGMHGSEPLVWLTRGQLDFGTVAVDGFFVISGYLIVKSWLNKPIARQYLLKRTLRIYPGYIVAYLLSLFVVGGLGAASAHVYFAHIPWHHVLTRIAMLGLPPATHVFEGLRYPYVNGSLWTIAYEFEGYLLVMALGMSGALRRASLCLLLFAVAFSGYAFLSLTHYSIAFPTTFAGEPNSWLRFSTFFLAGTCLYLYRDAIAFRRTWAWAAAIVLIATLCAGRGTAVALPICGAYLLLYAAFRPCRLLAQVGAKTDLSYGMYLYAWPCQILLLWHFRQINPCLLFALALVPTTLLSWLSWRCVEKPGQALAHCALPPGWKAVPGYMLAVLRTRRPVTARVNS